MEKFELTKTFNTPYIMLDPDQGVLKFEGRSIPEDPGDFYEKIIEWIHQYFRHPNNVTTLEFKLEYVNSGSSKYILEILRILQKYHESGKDAMVKWYYEEDDESIMELGIHYKNTVNIPIELLDYY